MTTETAPRRAMGSHHSARADTTTWLTPPHEPEECFICHFYWPCQEAEQEAAA